MKENANDLDRMTLDVLLAEYQQLYEHNRHDNNIGSTLQILLATASFGVLTYTINLDEMNFYYLLFASFISIGLYIYYIFYFEQLIVVINARFKRIAEIEKIWSSHFSLLGESFVQNFDTRVKAQKNEISFEGISKSTSLARAIIFVSGKISSRFFRLAFLFILIGLWIARIAHEIALNFEEMHQASTSGML